MRKPLIIANWKMNTNLSDAVVIAASIKKAAEDLEAEIVLCPPFVWLVPIFEIIENGPRNLKLGAQNMWFADSGAMTGEISPIMLKEMVKYVILGHSERRAHFGESNALINDKIHAAFRHNITPIVCVGELKKMHKEKRGRGRPDRIEMKSDVVHQLEAALKGVSKEKAEKIVVAYEPVWAIGTGNPASGAYAAGVIEKLRHVFKQKYSRDLAERVRILYGGSVDSSNIQEFIYQPEIDGALVGGASLKVKEFIAICKEAGGRE